MFNNSGSQWRKWDLHVHTPLDHEWIGRPNLNTLEQKKQYAKTYIDFAASENLSVLGITDHNFCNRLEESLLPYIIEEANERGITILPGFEITVNEGNGIHILALFKEDTKLDLIHALVRKLFPVGTDLTPKEVPVSDCSLEGLKNELDEAKFDYVLIYAHADSSNGVLHSGSIKGTMRMNAWQHEFMRICQIAKPVEEYSGFNRTVFDNIEPQHKRKQLPAFICASDCRLIKKENCEAGRHYMGEKFTWIKGNPSLEGLKEIQFEPTLRVKIQNDYPSKKIPYNVIKAVRFLDNSGDSEFPPHSIPLNPDLNVIIGGKSSGKSLLLYHIASTIDFEQVQGKMPDGDKNRENNEGKYRFKSKSIDFEVTWANGDSQLYSKNQNSDKANYSILYLPQSYIAELADTEGKKTRKKVGKIIRDILLQKMDYKRYYDGFIDEVKKLDLLRENLVSDLFLAIEAHSTATKNLKLLGDKAAIEGFINQLQQKIANLKSNSKIDETLSAEYEQIRLENDLLKSELSDLEEDRVKLDDYFSHLQQSVNSLIAKKEILLADLKNPSILSKATEVTSPLDSMVNVVSEFNKSLLFEGAFIDNIREKKEQQLLILAERLAPIAEKFSGKDEIQMQEKLLEEECLKLHKIKQFELELETKASQVVDYKNALFSEYRKTVGEYDKIIARLNERGKEIQNLTLTGSVKFYTKRYLDRIRQQINLRTSGKYLDQIKLSDEIEHIHEFSNIEDLITEMEKLYEYVMSDALAVKGAFTKKDLINSLFSDEFFDYWEVVSGGDEIANMSPGKAGLVLLKLLIELSDSQCPILIDQPEDNLDNRSIYNDLVQYIRNKKESRQFIVVTHNPNIVVGSDAENVIVANQNDQDPARKNKYYQFDYISGALEYSFPKKRDKNVLTSMGIREHVSEILEGGEDAFKKREEKYRYL